MRLSYKTTMFSCFTGYVVQALINNFLPLLFITLQNTYDIPLSKITLLVTINFATQLIVDLLAMFFVDKIGYRAAIVLAHVCSALGFLFIAVLPEVIPDPYIGILMAVMVYAIGGGLIEVLVSPIMESCPTDNKETAMSLLHSFYCWGQVSVVLLSTIYFAVFGIENWRILACIWAMLPVVNGIVLTKTPIAPLIADGEKGMTIAELFKNHIFWLFMLMMICAGASELSVSQWASVFAEQGLGISKSAGDLAGPMAFAIFMGSARAFYGKFGEKINLDRFMKISGILCVCSYLVIALVPSPVVSLIGCAVCGLSVGSMWPGTFSKAAAALKRGGTAMFALLALAGDFGCSTGPTLVGMTASSTGDNLKTGILSAAVFPLVLVICLIWGKYTSDKS